MQVDLRAVAFDGWRHAPGHANVHHHSGLRAWKIGLANVMKEEAVVRGGRLAVRNLLVAGAVRTLGHCGNGIPCCSSRSLSYVGRPRAGFDTHKNLAI